MDVRWLQDFLSVAEIGSFRAAATARHSSQPAFSRRIQALEAWLGVALIDRSQYPTALTPAGQSFRSHAADILRHISDTRSEILGEPSGEDEIITVSLPQTLAIARFPKWWSEWKDAAQCKSCRILAANVHDAVTTFVAGQADMLLFFHHAEQPILLNPDQYHRVEIAREWMRPFSAVRRGIPKFVLPGKPLQPLPLLAYSPGAFLGRIAELILLSTPEKLHGAPVFVSDLADALLGMTIASHGVAWLPESTAEAAVRAGAIRAIGDNRWSLPITINAYRDRNNERPAVKRLMKVLEASTEETTISPTGIKASNQ